MPKITKRVVDSAAPTDGKRLLLWDDELKGFGLLILPSGAKTYIANYRVGGRGDTRTGRRGRAGVSGGPGAAEGPVRTLGAVLSWAVSRKLIDAIPAKGVPLLRLRKRDAWLTADELSRLVETVETMQDAA